MNFDEFWYRDRNEPDVFGSGSVGAGKNLSTNDPFGENESIWLSTQTIGSNSVYVLVYIDGLY